MQGRAPNGDGEHLAAYVLSFIMLRVCFLLF
jgi:hypothetical protein